MSLALAATGLRSSVTNFLASSRISMMLLSRAKSGARGKDATNKVTKPNWMTGGRGTQTISILWPAGSTFILLPLTQILTSSFLLSFLLSSTSSLTSCSNLFKIHFLWNFFFLTQYVDGLKTLRADWLVRPGFRTWFFRSVWGRTLSAWLLVC